MRKGPGIVYDKLWWRRSHFRSDDFNLTNRKHGSAAGSDVKQDKSDHNPNTKLCLFDKNNKNIQYFIHITFNSWNINTYKTHIKFQKNYIFKENFQY